METSGTSPHVFDAAVSLTTNGRDNYEGSTNPAYDNMVGPFGGTIAATLLNAVMCHPERLGEPVSLTVHYAAPIAAGRFLVQTRALRTNRTTQHWSVELAQADEVVAFATVLTASRRDTWGATDAIFPQVPTAESIALAPSLAPVAWTRCYEMRFIDGGPDIGVGSGTSSETRLWIRDQPPRVLDFLSLSAICDAFFPRIFIRRPKWVPIGTVTLTTHFYADAIQLNAIGTNRVFGAARALSFAKGFFDQTVEIWSAEGVLLATSHQMVYYKE